MIHREKWTYADQIEYINEMIEKMRIYHTNNCALKSN